MAVFNTHLKALLLKKSAADGRLITQTEVAEQTGLSLPTISRWHKGKVDRIEATTVKPLIEFFGCTFADLVTYEHESE